MSARLFSNTPNLCSTVSPPAPPLAALSKGVNWKACSASESATGSTKGLSAAKGKSNVELSTAVSKLTYLSKSDASKPSQIFLLPGSLISEERSSKGTSTKVALLRAVGGSTRFFVVRLHDLWGTATSSRPSTSNTDMIAQRTGPSSPGPGTSKMPTGYCGSGKGCPELTS